MPNLRIEKKRFDELMGSEYSFQRLDGLGFEYGIQIQKQEQNDKEGNHIVNYKFQCMNNRPDLLSENSLTRAFKVYMGIEKTPEVTLSKPITTMIIDPSIKGVRDYVVCAVLRGVIFDEKSYKAFLDTQEKLHQTFCRERKYASIGTHDLDTLQSPFTYSAKEPKDFKLIPLFHKEQVDGFGMMEALQKHKLKEYLHLIRDMPRYPVICDANGIVGSVPPIINSEHSKLRLQTKNILIQVTAISKNKAMVCLNTLIWGFSQYCGTKFQVEPVEIIDGEQKFMTPDISPKIFTAYHKNAQTMIGATLTQEQILHYLERSGLKGEIINGQQYKIIVPFWRADILHECDIIEDISICYGFKKIIPKLPKSATVGQRVRLNKFSDFVRHEMAQAQFNEVLNFALCSRADLTSNLLNEDETKMIQIQNARTKEFQTGRTTLIPGLLKTVLENKANPLPYKLFQTGDCILIDQSTDTGAKNSKMVAAILTDEVHSNSKVSLFAQLHGSLDLLLKKCNLKFEKDYKFVSSSDDKFFKGQQFKVLVKGEDIGSIGVLHPTILGKFGWSHPLVVWQLSVQKLQHYYSESFK